MSIAREPLRFTLRVWELGLSSAAEAARIGLELLEPEPESEPQAAPSPGNGRGPAAGVSVPVEPPPPRAEPPPAAAPPVPDGLVPDHVDEEPVLVAESAEEGAEDGAGAELHVDPPWDGYGRMTAADIRDRLTAAGPEEAAAVQLYESTHKGRRSVLEAAERALRR